MSKRNTIRYSRYEDIPLFLDALDVVHVLGLPRANVYNMFYAEDFPTIIIGGRKLVRKEKLFSWLETHQHSLPQELSKPDKRHPQTLEG